MSNKLLNNTTLGAQGNDNHSSLGIFITCYFFKLINYLFIYFIYYYYFFMLAAYKGFILSV